jgi:ABC-type lipoprotein release transport system permease subunit
MGLKVQDVQNKSKVSAEILRGYNTTLEWNTWTEANSTFQEATRRLGIER